MNGQSLWITSIATMEAISVAPSSCRLLFPSSSSSSSPHYLCFPSNHSVNHHPHRNAFPSLRIFFSKCSREGNGYSLAEGSDSSPASCGRRGLVSTATLPFVLPHITFTSSVFAQSFDAGVDLLIRTEVRKVLSKIKAAGMLRLAFHDAGTFDLNTKTGGMNGSIIYELDRPENAGLSKSIKVLQKVKNELDRVLQVSWADLIAVTGSEAVSLCGGPIIPVHIGRKDSRSPDPLGKLPLESLNASGLKKCFQEKGFSAQELVALSGAHTLGSKGFGNPYIFDISYYKILLEKPWTSPGEMSGMIGLPSDRALVEDDECLRWITTYASDQLKFFYDFSSAYTKLVNSGAMWVE